MTCLVCGSPQSEHHFGGQSCRACAAFFRRYFNSKKFAIIQCVCKTKQPNSYPCRSCRVAKCLAIGMTPKKLHGQRDPNGRSCRKYTFPASPPDLLLPLPIILKETFNLTSSLPNFFEYEKKRGEIFPKPDLLGIFEATCLTKQDVHLTSEFVIKAFPDFENQSASDKKALLHNFLIKIWNLDPLLDHVAKREEYRIMDEVDIQKLMFPLFEGSFMKGAEMEREEIWRTFGTYWKQFFSLLIEPLISLSLDQTELMAIIWILFFDHAYININQNGADFCWNIRKVILRELRNYEMEKNKDTEDAENRFLEILEVPLIVERGDKQFHDEMILCEMKKLRMHDDFKAILKKQKI